MSMMLSTPANRFRKNMAVAALTFGVVTLVTFAALLNSPVAAQEGAPERIPDDKECLDCHKKTFSGPVSHMGAEDCEACHEHEDEGLHAFTDAVPKEELCTQCHEIDLAGAVHGPVAKSDCTACHEVHSARQPKLLKLPMAQLCSSCHESVAGAPKEHQHGPYAVGLCQGCHAPHASQNESLLLAEGSALCKRCHEEFTEEESGWHMPVQQDCTICHDAHESDVKFMLHEKAPDLCTECHDDMGQRIAKGKSVHKALLTDTSCLGCHLPHRSEFGKLLRTPSEDLCLTCHDRTYEHEGKRPMVNMKALLAANPNHHGPVKEKNCEGCHDPHAADTFRLLRKPYPEKFYAPYERDNFALCFECHPDDLVKQETSKATGFRDGTRNLHFLHVNKKKKGRTCRACHEVHASDQPRHLRRTTPFGQWDLPIGFEKSGDGGSCAPGCHAPKTYSRGLDE